MPQNQSRPRVFAEEFPENPIVWGIFCVSEPPTVLEDPGGFPACNFAVDIDANVVMVLNDLPAEAALDFNSGTKPRLNLFRFGERGPYALWWVRDVALEDHFEAIWAFSSHPSWRPHCVHSPVASPSAPGRTHHLHLVPYGSALGRERLTFRDARPACGPCPCATATARLSV